MFSFTHYAAHGGDKAAEVNQCSEKIFDELEKSI